MNVAFIHPDALWLLIVLPLMWGVALIAPSPGAAWQRRIALILRTLMVLALVGALAGAQVAQPPGFTTTIFLLDGSDSVAVSQRARAEAFIAQALAAMPPDDQAGVVVFGREALVELHLQETFSDVVKTDKTGLSKTAHTRWMISAFANFLPGSTIFRLA